MDHIGKRVHLELDFAEEDWLKIEGMFYYIAYIAEALYPDLDPLTGGANPRKKARYLEARVKVSFNQCNFVAAMDSALCAAIPVPSKNQYKVFIAKTSVPAIVQAGDIMTSNQALFTAVGQMVYAAYVSDYRSGSEEAHEEAKDFLDKAMITLDTWKRLRPMFLSETLQGSPFTEIAKRLSKMAMDEL